jgi:nucleolar protein 12
VPLATPTEALPGEDSEKDANKREKREKERVAAWRAQRDALEAGGRAAEEADNAQTFIDSKGKRKVAFIKKDVSAVRPDAAGFH